MKLKLKKTIPTLDQLAESYLEHANVEKAAHREKEVVSEEIKGEARVSGKPSGKRILLPSSKYIIGIQKAESAPTIDIELAKKKLSPIQFRACQELTFIPALFEQLVMQGKINSKVALSLLIPGKSTERVLVKLRGKKGKDEDQD